MDPLMLSAVLPDDLQLSRAAAARYAALSALPPRTKGDVAPRAHHWAWRPVPQH
jgi:hypothetical protein